MAPVVVATTLTACQPGMRNYKHYELSTIGCIGCYYCSGSERTLPASEGYQTVMDHLET